jgi:hypothetical protein
MKKGMVVVGFILIIIYIISYIFLSFLISYFDDQVEGKNEEIERIKNGPICPVGSPPICSNGSTSNITELKHMISNQKEYRDTFNELLWLLTPVSMVGIILISYGCFINPTHQDAFELIKIIGIISLIVGMIILPIGYFLTLQNTPFGTNNDIDANEKRLSNDLFVAGIIFLTLSFSFIIYFLSFRNKMKVDNIKSSKNLKISKKQSKANILSSDNKTR